MIEIERLERIRKGKYHLDLLYKNKILNYTLNIDSKGFIKIHELHTVFLYESQTKEITKFIIKIFN